MEKKEATWEENFVTTVITKSTAEKGLAARLRRADNPATEYQSWELLAAMNVDLEKENQRMPFVTVASAIAKSKADHNGTLSLGKAIAACYEDGSENNQARARLRRLLACNELLELVRILRGTLSLINNKVARPLDFIRLLKQLRRFPFNSQQVKSQWAQEFYTKPLKSSGEET